MSTFDEIRVLALSLDSPRFFARMDEWIRGGMTSPQLEGRVSGSRVPPMPALSGTDEWVMGEVAEYRSHLEDVRAAMDIGDHRTALRHLRAAYKFETAYLAPKTPTGEQVELASDEPCCVKCHKTKEMHHRVSRTPWRRKRGLCAACYQAWRAAGSPLDVYPDPVEQSA